MNFFIGLSSQLSLVWLKHNLISKQLTSALTDYLPGREPKKTIIFYSSRNFDSTIIIKNIGIFFTLPVNI